MANTNEVRGENPRPKKRKKRRSRAGDIALTVGKVLGTILLVGAVTGAILACFAAAYITSYIIPKADLDIGDFSTDLSTTMYYTDETGTQQELRTIYGGANRVWVKYGDLPENLINATICTEDKRFWDHKGVDWIRTASSVLAMFTGGDIQGGSTITQQFIKNFTFENEVTVQRKILEIFRALEFEKNYKKENILEMYLNYIYLGARSDGVYTASYTYFGKHVSELSLAECATLIGITNNPSIYGPYVTHRNADGTTDLSWGRKNNAKRAKTTILWNMLLQEKISQEEYDQACAEIDAGLNFVRVVGEQHEESVYTWYEDQVINDVLRDLQEKLGYSEKIAVDRVYYGGLKIETCLDMNIQNTVDSVYENMENLPYTSGSGQQLQSGIVIVDPEGNVVALSGGMGEKELSRAFSRATTYRSPGSSFKPLSVYAPAIDLGLITPASVLDDIPYRLNDDGSGWPKNSYGNYKGRMSVRDGVTISSNPLALSGLTQLTPQASFDFLNGKLGFKLVESKLVNDKVMSDIDLSPLAMGGLTDGVSAMEMAGAYATFPRGGNYLSPRTYTRVYDSNGKILLDNTADRIPTQVIKPTTAWYINSMLRDVVSNKKVGGSSATGYNAIFDGMTIAGKTGSTDSNKDRWFVGYTPYYTAAVWCGYDQPERIKVNNYENPAAVLWNKVMSQIHTGLENKDFPVPAGAGDPVQVAVCADSGMRASDGCAIDPRGSRVRYEYFFSDDAPSPYCTVHSEPVEVCKDSPILGADGVATAGYHLAGEFCPVESRVSVAYMTLDRDPSLGASAQDNAYTKTYLESQGPCTVHTAAPEPVPYDPATFDITNEATWPTQEQWPGFDPTKPETWPIISVEPPPGIPGETEPPGTGEEEPTVPPTTSPDVGPDDSEPFLPVA